MKLTGVRVHNLKNIDLEIPDHALVVFCGVSGSGKSSLAFDTIYAEGQRSYLESLPSWVREQIGDFVKPDFDYIEGLSPTLAIEQKKNSSLRRSTLGTLTSIYDYWRVLFAHLALLYSPSTQKPLLADHPSRIARKILATFTGKSVLVLSPYLRHHKGNLKEAIEKAQKMGFRKLRIDGALYTIDENLIAFDEGAFHDLEIVIEKITPKEFSTTFADTIYSALEWGSGSLLLIDDEGKEHFYSTEALCPESGRYYERPKAHHYSFNHPQGICPSCKGEGVEMLFDLSLIIDPEKSILEDCCFVAPSAEAQRWKAVYGAVAKWGDFSLKKPWKTLSREAKELFLYGREDLKLRLDYETIEWRGVLKLAQQRIASHKTERAKKKLSLCMKEAPCSCCHGARITPIAAAARFMDQTLHQICEKTVVELLQWIETLRLTEDQKPAGVPLLEEIQKRLIFLEKVGLGYLSLSRRGDTLSGGEVQRARLASQLGSGLVGVTYVLDEPSIGLHPIDEKKLIDALKDLRDRGNHVLVVEHDEEMIRSADHIVDVGPLGGPFGGEILVSGPLDALFRSNRSLTAAYLTGKKRIEEPSSARISHRTLSLYGASLHSLKNIQCHIPVGLMTAVVGVSGSGKSSLIVDTLYPALSAYLNGEQDGKFPYLQKLEGAEHFKRVLLIDQSPIGRTPRSNAVTYTSIFDAIRDLFAQLPEARALGFSASRFSFNVKEGSCPLCLGMGMIELDPQLLEGEWRCCPECEGRRFDAMTLSIQYRGKNIYQVLEMDVSEAVLFFQEMPSIHKQLLLLEQVGLGYLRIGQAATTLSGGEAQRIKLAKELMRSSKGDTLYILDEPTTGLHFEDIHKLVTVLRSLVEKGNTIVMVEHHLHMIHACDFAIELGPVGGSGGGYLLETGSPRELAAKDTPTGRALADHFALKPKTTFADGKGKKNKIDHITITGARQKNLHDLSLTIPRDQITLISGPSGSGKSALALDTLFAEGQRRYVESLSPYARKWIEQAESADVDLVEGLSPTVAIPKTQHAFHRRATLGTASQIYEELRVLFADSATAYCPVSGEKIRKVLPSDIESEILSFPEGQYIEILAPLDSSKLSNIGDECQKWAKAGFLRVRLGGHFYLLDEPIPEHALKAFKAELLIDRFKVGQKQLPRVQQAVALALSMNPKGVLLKTEKEERLLYLGFLAPSSSLFYPPITVKTFSFNDKEGMCLTCEGLGEIDGFELHKPPLKTILSLISKRAVPKILSKMVEGEEMGEWIDCKGGFSLRWRGLKELLTLISRYGKGHLFKELSKFATRHLCPDCKGDRLNPLASHARLASKSLGELMQMPLFEFRKWVCTLDVGKLQQVLLSRVDCVLDLGLGHLSLGRTLPTLSRGEMMRLKMARQLKTHLSGITYILDEPSLGLHPVDMEKVLSLFIKLKQKGNTLILLDNDPKIAEIADHRIHLGPLSGPQGGRITKPPCIPCNEKNGSSTHAEKSQCRLYKKRENHPKEWFTLPPSSLHNIHDLSCKLPLHRMTLIVGPSGSGKTTLLHGLIKPYLLREGYSLQWIDLTQIQIQKRADLATFTDIAPHLRQFYAALPKARSLGLAGRHFSPNHLSGMCRECFGIGSKVVKLDLLPPATIICPLCRGMRLCDKSLLVDYQGLNFGQMLGLTVEQALLFLPPIPKVVQLLSLLMDLGLNYLKLGQTLTSMAFGEVSLLAMASYFAKQPRRKTVYLLDEPSASFDSQQILRLAQMFHQVCHKGHSLFIVDHDRYLIDQADWIVEMGPGAGDFGGKIVFNGTPSQKSASLSKH